jgi:AraC family transcriptional regulator of adaptative response / DNA-3-methyladenine glycosylase II
VTLKSSITARASADDTRVGDDAADREIEALVALVRALRADPADRAWSSGLERAAGFDADRLRALLREHYHTTPSDLLRHARVAAACTAMAERGLTADAAGVAAGFTSARAYERELSRTTGLTPDAYAALAQQTEFVLALPTGYCADAVLRVNSRDDESPAERVDGRRRVKALDASGKPALLHMTLSRGSAHCRIETRGTPSPRTIYAAHAVAARLLGLAGDSIASLRHLRSPRDLALLARRRGLRVSLMSNVFETLCWAIIGQQVNLRFASILRRRLIERCGRGAPSGMRSHPAPADVAALEPAELRAMQFSGRKAEYLVGAARAVASGALVLEDLVSRPAEHARAALTALNGIGPWTAEYVLLRGLGLADCVPVGDAGLVAALRRHYEIDERPDAARTRALMERFAPARSLATEHLWQSLRD